MTTPTGPDAPGAQDECAACGAARWTHNNPTVAGLCPSFVELSYGTRMARFVEAAQKLARHVTAARVALADAMASTAELYAAMQQAGLLPEDGPDATAPEAVGKHARDAAVATIAEALDVPAEMLTGPSSDGLPDHWADAAPFPATRNPFGREHHQEAPREADATEVIPAAQNPSPSALLAPGDRAVLWSWDARNKGWVQISEGAAQDMEEGRDRRYQAAANNDIPGAAWIVLAPGAKPAGHPDLLGVPTT